MNSPCQNCPERRLVCHDRCPMYLAYHEERVAECAARRSRRQVDEYIIKAVIRVKRSH